MPTLTVRRVTTFSFDQLSAFPTSFRSIEVFHVLITFRMSRRRREMYIGHSPLCVCPSPHSHTTARTRMYNLGNVRRGCRLVVHYLADLQLAHGFPCYDNIARTRNVSECLHSLYAWFCVLMFLLNYVFISKCMFELVSWSLMSLFSTNTAIPETKSQGWRVIFLPSEGRLAIY